MILRLDSEKLAETLIFGQKWPFFYQNGPNGIFRAKSENVTSVALGSPKFVPKIKNSYEQILRSLSNARTDARTDRRTDVNL